MNIVIPKLVSKRSCNICTSATTKQYNELQWKHIDDKLRMIQSDIHEVKSMIYKLDEHYTQLNSNYQWISNITLYAVMILSGIGGVFMKSFIDNKLQSKETKEFK